ncbi:HMG-box domain-containing protein [Aspergillus affinis]|uniref:HMG-box domain-containing protein n=1 Tax=Aspergillus affinis TaxID=1070780 RepID=UPI0022FEA819|nr:uncharacterized protein KD926_008270 [Aspergillus affinis]KAI9040447.1 hypothetical protein KD926_008270 [Aspergillus affinis]
MTATTGFLSGHPPSPPQSTDGATPEPHQNPCIAIRYSQPGVVDSAAFHGNGVADEAIYGSSSQSSMVSTRSLPLQDFAVSNRTQDYHNSPFSHTMPLPSTQMIPNGVQVETPPPTSDDDFLRGSPSSPSQWLSPPGQSRPHPKAKLRKAPRSPRRSGKQRKIDYPGMPGPLSELTKHMAGVPVKDMEEWVHRPIEVRQQVAKEKGKIARPMNSFMLYRSAYADRAKSWFAQSNHQVVSKTAGESWRLESPEVRKKYEVLAKIEKINHERAHPGYRFTPEKDKKKRDKTPDKSIEGPLQSSPFSSHTARSISSDLGSGWDSRGSTPFSFVEHGLPAGGYLNSSWHSSKSGRPAPGMMSSPEPPQFMQQTVHPSLMGSHVEDVRFRRVGLQDVQYTTSTALAGLPGAAHHELLQPQTAPGAGPDGQLDPQLLGLPGDASNGGAYGNIHYPAWHETAANNLYLPTTLSPTSMTYPAGSAYQPGSYQSGPVYHTGSPAGMDGRDAWDPTHDGSMETGGEFDNWINSHQPGY